MGVRLFVALDLPAEMRDAIARWQAGFDPAMRAVRPEGLHVTLVFLGARDEGDVDAIAEAVFSRVRGVPAPVIELSPEPVAIPRGKRPRLFALEGESPGAVDLQRGVEEGLVAGGWHEPEDRPFWPHVTVARVRPASKGSRKPARVESPPQPVPVPDRTYVCRPTALVRLVLFRSLTKRGGAEYRPMAELELPPARTER